MGINLKPLGASGTSSNYNILPYRVRFGNSTSTDIYQKNSVEKYVSENAIKANIATNPEIKRIINEINAPLKLNMNELQELLENHALETQKIALGIIDNLPKALKDRVNIKSVKEAAYLHDIGKVLIPVDILNKDGKFTDEEREIMHKHSQLGYELLKNTDIDTRTLHLVKYHHQNANRTGYPKVQNDFIADINLQIVSTADKYSAMLEKRSYKDGFDENKALTLLYKDVKNGNSSPLVFNALVNYVNNEKSGNYKKANLLYQSSEVFFQPLIIFCSTLSCSLFMLFLNYETGFIRYLNFINYFGAF